MEKVFKLEWNNITRRGDYSSPHIPKNEWAGADEKKGFTIKFVAVQ